MIKAFVDLEKKLSCIFGHLKRKRHVDILVSHGAGVSIKDCEEKIALNHMRSNVLFNSEAFETLVSQKSKKCMEKL